MTEMPHFLSTPPVLIHRKAMGPTELRPAPHGATLHLSVVVSSVGRIAQTQMLAMVLPPCDGPMTVTAECAQQNFPPPPPPETDYQRRRRLINDAVGTAIRSAGAGLSADTAQSAVDAVMDALDGEWAEDCDLDHEPEL